MIILKVIVGVVALAFIGIELLAFAKRITE
jgi:hypothetical protein